MKITMRTKILATILAAVLYWAVIQICSNNSVDDAPCGRSNMSDQELREAYSEYNYRYFGNRLPSVLIDQNEHNDNYMADTTKTNGQFAIHFNQKYVGATRVEKEVLLHEMCHVQTWEDHPPFTNQSVFHGPKWRTCMLSLDAAGAWRELIIDEYQEQM